MGICAGAFGMGSLGGRSHRASIPNSEGKVPLWWEFLETEAATLGGALGPFRKLPLK